MLRVAWAVMISAASLGISLRSAQAEPLSHPRALASLARASDDPLTASELAADLRAAAMITSVPASLTPSLTTAAVSRAIIVNNGCQLWSGEVKSRPCVYGDTRSRTSVALFGDSHAGAWFPALEQISRHRHWRLLIFTKDGCSPPAVTLISGGVAHPDCNTWRSNTEAQIAAVHPAVVFVSWARWIEARSTAEPGVPTGYGSPWENGVAATFRFLHHAAGHVIFISDVPTLKFGAADCVSGHLTNLQACQDTPLTTAIVMPMIKAEELQIAAQVHIDSIDPIPWFCTATVCPVIVHNILVYRDSAHMTSAWSKFISPVLAASINSILGGAAVAYTQTQRRATASVVRIAFPESDRPNGQRDRDAYGHQGPSLNRSLLVSEAAGLICPASRPSHCCSLSRRRRRSPPAGRLLCPTRGRGAHDRVGDRGTMPDGQNRCLQCPEALRALRCPRRPDGCLADKAAPGWARRGLR